MDNTSREDVASFQFRTAHEVLSIQLAKQNKKPAYGGINYGAQRKTHRTTMSKFVLPVKQKPSDNERYGPKTVPPSRNNDQPKVEIHERLVNVEPQMVTLIENEIMNKHEHVGWDNVCGLDYAKSIIRESIINPMLRPDLFTGIRSPPRGILLFGPPGTGKTLIGKCIASNANATFFNISASSLTSRYVGDGEKMVRALFAVAAVHQPSVIFVDEIDSLLCQRTDSEHESARRIKTEFLIQFDGVRTKEDDRIFVIGATNRPQDLDHAMRRRLVRRLYIPLPELAGRINLISNLFKPIENDLNANDLLEIGKLTEGYSGADLNSLSQEAAMGPIRAIPFDQFATVGKDMVRPVNIDDFKAALDHVRPSVTEEDITSFVEWNKLYGAK
ncbi:fidgetin-like protein 1 [Teleopsis dalmanni]|uniref:fidgetin-like protein 1 n=1 Tax=Teleopsis dalmanni TaxID=139649 RepID=UPI0018CCE82F|nr:fidgetin-like protein 1 [Teleopsis dalmanni]XP_037934541.1 fidgetin-like protein 1 [Teleopsis dalmanni]